MGKKKLEICFVKGNWVTVRSSSSFKKNKIGQSPDSHVPLRRKELGDHPIFLKKMKIK